MAWSAVYETATGRLVSVGTVVADPLPAGMAVLALPDAPADAQMWDDTARAYVVRPPPPALVDRVVEFAADPDIASMTAANKIKAAAAIGRLFAGDLAGMRYH